MGMRGTEIAAYMGLTDQSYYNFSGVIRKKLGLMEYKTKLDIFFREMSCLIWLHLLHKPVHCGAFRVVVKERYP